MVRPPEHEGRAAPQLPSRFGDLARKHLRIARTPCRAGLRPGTQHAGRLFRRANARPEIHQSLREIACPPRRQKALGEPPNLRLGGRQLRFHGKQARDHAFSIAVDRGRSRPESDGCDRGCAVGADAGQRTKLGFALREVSPMALDHCLRAGVQIARPRVVAKSRPQLEHIFERRARKNAHVWPAGSKAREIRGNGFYRRLLQHDLGEPYPIRVRLLARQCAPGKHAAMAVIPAEQRLGRRTETAFPQRRVIALARLLSPRNRRC